MGAIQAWAALSQLSPEDWQSRWSQIVQRIRVVESVEDESLLLHDLLNRRELCVLAFVNAHAMNCVVEDPFFNEALLGADVLLRDGSGMAGLYRQSGRSAGLNMNGTDLIPKFLAAARGRRVALWGAEEPYLSVAAQRARDAWEADVVSIEHGFHGAEHYEHLATTLHADVLVLGMGMPKQERVAALVRDATSGPMLVICGGAIIDFLGGKMSRAPRWLRGLGAEWVYRLVLEPKRLFRRYVIGNPLFLLRVRQWSKNSRMQ